MSRLAGNNVHYFLMCLRKTMRNMLISKALIHIIDEPTQKIDYNH